MPKKQTASGATVSDAYLEILADRGVDYLFANAGTDFAPLIEALAKAQSTGARIPIPVTCPHENTAVHLAIGYYLVTGRPQAVMVHVNVGTANGLNGILNASRGNVPVLFTAGRTPTNEDTLHGHRSLDIHWTQEMFDQAGMVREAVKWDYELRNAEQLDTVIDRALNVAMSEPRGPVYLSLPREVLALPANGLSYDSPARRHAASGSAPDPDAADEVAAILAKAENPLIVTNWAGRSAETWHALSDFAANHAIPVVQYRNRYASIPTDHPMHMGYDHSDLLSGADAILVVDTAVPWLPAVHEVRDDAKVIHMASDPLHGYVPMRGHPCDYALAARSDLGLRALDAAMQAHAGAAKTRREARRGELAKRRATLVEGWQAQLARVKDNAPLHPAFVTSCINEIKGADTIVTRESPLQQPYLDTTQPLTCISAGAASGLGWGLGCAIGAKLGAPDKLVIATQGDGAYMFCAPVSAHYVAAEMDAPFLTVIFNNGRWNAVRRATTGLTKDGYAAKSNRQPLTFLDAAPNYEKTVEVADGYGEKVTEPDQLMPALERALKAVTVERRQALLNVFCSA